MTRFPGGDGGTELQNDERYAARELDISGAAGIDLTLDVVTVILI
jgi:hypothetical protein